MKHCRIYFLLLFSKYNDTYSLFYGDRILSVCFYALFIIQFNYLLLIFCVSCLWILLNPKQFLENIKFKL